MNNDNDFKINLLKMYFMKPCNIGGIDIHQPTIDEIIEFGEDKFWNFMYTFCGNPSSMKLELWRNGIDWTKITEFQLFLLLQNNFTLDKTSIIFGDFDFTFLKPVENEKTIIKEDGTEEIISEISFIYLKNPEIIIDEKIYLDIISYLRCMIDYHPKVIKARNKVTKETIIWEEENKLRILEKQKKDTGNIIESPLLPLISSYINHPGCSYKKTELSEIGIFEFIDGVKRLQIYESVTSLMRGMYSGMLDTSKMNLEKELNWTRSLYND